MLQQAMKLKHWGFFVLTIEDLAKQNKWFHVWVLARYYYRVGKEPILTDAQYDQLTTVLRKNCYEVAKDYLERTYDDDPIPEDFLKLIGEEPVEFSSFANRTEFLNILDEDKSLSINSVTSYEEAFEFCKDKRDKKLDIIASLKLDGVNHKDLYIDDKLKLSMSRGRAGTGFDFTEQIYNCLPCQINTNLAELKVTGECFVTKEGLQILRDRYRNDKYKTSKSAAISMLRVKHASADYQYLKAKVFAAEGLATTLEDTFLKLEDMGFDVVPYIKILWQNIPETFEEFKPWFKECVMDVIHAEQLSEDMPADGMVLEVNDLLWNDTITGQYSNKQLACKFEHWSFDVYKAVVTDIVVSQRRVNASIRIRIEPLITKDDCEAKWINGFNPEILIRNNIRVGTEAYFERNSGAVNILIYGKRLEEILNE